MAKSPRFRLPDVRTRVRQAAAGLRHEIAGWARRRAFWIRPEWRARWLSPQCIWGCAALSVLLLACAGAFLQGLRPDPLDTPRPLRLLWWLRPLEWGAERRLDVVPGRLRDVSVVPGTREVWVAGSHGVARSTAPDSGWVMLQGPLVQNFYRRATTFASAAPPVGPPSLLHLRFVTRRTAWAVAEDGRVLASRTGGDRWQWVPGPRGRVTALEFSPGGAGWLVADGQVYALTSRGAATQPSRGARGVRALHFPTENIGWAVGEGGAVWMSIDGGRSWKERRRGGAGTLNAVRFADARTGVAVGDSGLVLRTADGGAAWDTVASGTRARLSGVYLRGRHGWAVGEGGTLLSTRDGGRRWRLHRAGTGDLDFVRFATRERGWAGGAQGLFATTDGGRVWRRVAAEDGAQINALAFTSPRTGFAVTAGGSILETRNGRTWRTTHLAGVPLRAVAFATPNAGWIGGARGEVFATRDGGHHWTRQRTDGVAEIRDLSFTSDSTGWAVDGAGAVLRMERRRRGWSTDRVLERFSPRALHMTSDSTGWIVGDSGRTAVLTRGGWVPDPSSSLNLWRAVRRGLNDVSFTDERHGWIAGDGGLLLSTTDGGLTWRPQEGMPSRRLLSVHFADPVVGVVGGEGGLVLRTWDGGRTWDTVHVAGTAQLRAVQAVQADRMWAAGERGVLYRRMQGSDWRDQRTHETLAAPWFYVMLLLVFVLLIPAVTPERKERSVLLAADRPLQTGERDSLRLGELASALSLFIRNDATEAPLTIAVTGRWGSGKSSLMNLLRDDLARHQYPIVSFNAWHHQKEESLLASLLENLRLQAIPPLLSVAGVRYRAHLLMRRARRHWVFASVTLLLGIYAVAYFAPGFPDRLVLAVTSLLPLLQLKSPQGGLAGPYLGLLAALPPLFALYQSLKGFGLDPARLVKLEGGRLKSAELRAQAGFRHRFAAEFADVTAALPNEIVVMVDDLDRCRPEVLLDVLEAINFLTSSGKCYVVMGLDRRLVKRYLSLAFTEVAKEMAGQENENPLAWRRVRTGLATRYLEKLVQVEVKIPAPTPDELSDILNPPGPPQDTRKPVRRAWDHGAVLWRRGSRVAMAGAVCVLISLTGARSAGLFAGPTPLMEEKGPAAAPFRSAAVQAPVPVPPRTATLRAAMESTSRTGALNVLMGVAALGLALLVLRSTSTDGVKVRDSHAVKRSLDIWHPAIAARRPTPRAIKQFHNRVRYYVAREEARETGGADTGPGRRKEDRLAAQSSQAAPEAQASQAGRGKIAERPSPEAAARRAQALVALTTIEYFYPHWFKSPAFPDDPDTLLSGVVLDEKNTAHDAQYRINLRHFIRAASLPAYLPDFRRLSSELADYRPARAVAVPDPRPEPAAPAQPKARTREVAHRLMADPDDADPLMQREVLQDQAEPPAAG